MLIVHNSNRLENLSASMALLLREPAGPVLAPETIIVQSNGMARWLSFELARSQGISANLEFPYPASFIWKLYQQVLGDELPSESPYNANRLQWAILDCLPAFKDQPAFAPISHYLEQTDPRNHFQLAAKIADVFDQYLVYRPDWIADWEGGLELNSAQRWQPKLWRALRERLGPMHRAHLQDRLFTELATAKGESILKGMPPRLSVFGISAFAPSVLATLEQLAKFSEVHLFMLAPCQEYWFDIATDKERLRRGDEYLEVGHSLLAATGKQGKECMDMLLEIEHDIAIDGYQSNGDDTLLQGIQQDILHLQQGQPLEQKSRWLDPSDHSIQVHSCHSALREVEVLHDQLLALFNDNPELEPADVCVLSPVLEEYAPFIDAVFGAFGRDEARHIPYTLADQPQREQELLRDALVAGLTIVQSRFAVDAVLSLLEQPAVMQRFDIDSAELERIAEWLADVNVHWGLDAAQREAEGLPARDFASWEQGMRRLWMGLSFGLPSDQQVTLSDELFNNVLPWPELEGSSIQTLSKLQQFIDTLASWQRQLKAQSQRSLTAWCDWLSIALTQLLAVPQELEFELVAMTESLIQLKQQGQSYSQDLSLAVVLDAWQAQLPRAEGGSRFLGGAVTIGSMVPMRSIPFKVLCLIGLNNAAYPRSLPAAEFDLMSGQYRRGDRSRRHDDRYLFLEALLSARERFYLSYTGQQQRDDKPLPPSVLVEELLDSVERGWQVEHGSVVDALITKHPLQAFSERYFHAGSFQADPFQADSKPRLFSFAQEFADAQMARQQVANTAGSNQSFVAKTEFDTLSSMDIGDLIAFARSPAQYLLRERVGMRIEPLEEPLSARETFALNGLQTWQLNQTLLTTTEQQDAAIQRQALKAAGLLPDEPVDELAYALAQSDIEPLAEPYQQWCQQQPLAAQAVELQLDDVLLQGWLPHAHGGGITGLTQYGLSHFTVSGDKPSNAVGYWIQHLLLCASRPAGVDYCSQAYNRDKAFAFMPLAPDSAKEHLRFWLQAWRSAQKQALILEPDAALQFARSAVKEIAKGIELLDAKRNAANNTFEKTLASSAECRQWYGGRRVELDDQSVTWIEGLYAPLLAAREDIK